MTRNLVNKTVLFSEFLEGEMREEDRTTCWVGASVSVCVVQGGWWISRPTSSCETIRPDVCHRHTRAYAHTHTHALHLSLSARVNTPSLTHTCVCIAIHVRPYCLPLGACYQSLFRGAV